MQRLSFSAISPGRLRRRGHFWRSGSRSDERSGAAKRSPHYGARDSASPRSERRSGSTGPRQRSPGSAAAGPPTTTSSPQPSSASPNSSPTAAGTAKSPPCCSSQSVQSRRTSRAYIASSASRPAPNSPVASTWHESLDRDGAVLERLEAEPQAGPVGRLAGVAGVLDEAVIVQPRRSLLARIVARSASMHARLSACSDVLTPRYAMRRTSQQADCQSAQTPDRFLTMERRLSLTVRKPQCRADLLCPGGPDGARLDSRSAPRTPPQRRVAPTARATPLGQSYIATGAADSAPVGVVEPVGRSYAAAVQRARVIAIDWSGRSGPDQKRALWLGEAQAGELVRLESERTRDQLV